MEQLREMEGERKKLAWTNPKSGMPVGKEVEKWLREGGEEGE